MEEILLPSKTESDDQLFRELMDRFTVLAEACARFSQEVYRRTETPTAAVTEDTVKRNVRIARSVFGGQSLETLGVIHMNQSIGFDGLKQALGPIGAAFLGRKLRQLEERGFIQRDDAMKGSSEARYTLTHKGKMIARLGEPVFLYLRLTEGWRGPGNGGASQATGARGKQSESR